MHSTVLRCGKSQEIDFQKTEGGGGRLVDNSWQTMMHLLKVFIPRLMDDSDRNGGGLHTSRSHFYPYHKKQNKKTICKHLHFLHNNKHVPQFTKALFVVYKDYMSGIDNMDFCSIFLQKKCEFPPGTLAPSHCPKTCSLWG